METNEIKQKLAALTTERFACQPDACTDAQLYHALLALTQQLAAGRPAPAGERKLYYFSAEFLMGKLLSNNLLALGLFGPVRALLDEMGRSLAALEEYEPEPSLGNGGLGRLAACFLDSIAALDLPGDGVGLNYHYGLFHQKFVDRRQQEQPDPWIEPESWLLPTGKTYTVPFGGFALDAVLYDIAVPGAHSEVANRLHLFDVADPAQPPAHGIDFDKRDIPHCLTSFLYPDDSDRDGQLLRVYQAGRPRLRPRRPQRACGHPDQRHPPLHGHPRADPPADRKGPDLRRRSGTGGKDLRLHQPHHPGRGPGKVAPGLYPDGGPPDRAHHPEAGPPGPPAQRRRPGGHPGRGGPGAHGPHGHPLRPLGERRGRPAHRHPQDQRAEALLRPVPGKVQQQDQRRHLPPLAGSLRPRPVPLDHPADRGRLDPGRRPAGAAAALCRRPGEPCQPAGGQAAQQAQAAGPAAPAPGGGGGRKLHL